MARKSGAIPFRVGQTVELTLEGLVGGGEAIARPGGYAVFVPGGAPGDRVLARVVSTKPQYARALIQRLEAPGPDRIEPPCPVFGACGGCQWQHLAYQAQLAAKRAQVADALARLGHLPDVPVREPLADPEPWGYRNKVHWPVARGADGNLRIGLYAARSHQVVDTEACAIQHPLNNRLLAFLREDLPARNWPVFDEATGEGWLRSIFAKVASRTDQLMVGLVTTTPDFPQAANFAEALAGRFPELASVVQNLNPDPGNTLLGGQTRVLWGAPTITEHVGGLAFEISATSFFQVNARAVELLYAEAGRQVGHPQGWVLDAYCGTGTIGLALAKAGRLASTVHPRLVGVDEVPAAIRDARENAVRNLGEAAADVAFHVGRVEDVLPELVEAHGPPAVAVLDPPRKGCDPTVIDALVAAGTPRITYVSCNPSTLARDAARLVAAGYRPGEAQPVDMFPQTAHVEVVLSFKAGG